MTKNIDSRVKEYWFNENEEGMPPKILDYIPGVGALLRIGREMAKGNETMPLSYYPFLAYHMMAISSILNC